MPTQCYAYKVKKKLSVVHLVSQNYNFVLIGIKLTKKIFKGTGINPSNVNTFIL